MLPAASTFRTASQALGAAAALVIPPLGPDSQPGTVFEIRAKGTGAWTFNHILGGSAPYPVAADTEVSIPVAAGGNTPIIVAGTGTLNFVVYGVA